MSETRSGKMKVKKSGLVFLFSNLMVLFSLVFLAGCGIKNPLGSEDMGPITAPVSAKTNVKILFVGNSYTFVNEVWGVVKGLAKETGVEVEYGVTANGGFFLSDNWVTQSKTGEPNASNQIASGKYDYVVFQDNSSTAWTPSRRADFLTNWAPRYAQFVKAHGAIPIFYMTWARKTNLEPGGTDQDLVSSMYTNASVANQARCAPSGNAFRKYIQNYGTNISLYHPDGSHPSEYGTYISGCAIFTTIFNRSPVGNPYRAVKNVWDIGPEWPWYWVHLSPANASNAQNIVWQTYNESLSVYRGP